MRKWLVFIGATLGGAAGWWIGARIGVMTALVVSMVGTGIGIYGGSRVARHYGA